MSTKKSKLDSEELNIDSTEEVILDAPEVTQGEIQEEVIENTTDIKEELTKAYTVHIGFYSELLANIVLGDMKYKGFEGNVLKTDKGYEVIAGVFSQKQNAINTKYKLETYGYKPEIK